MSFDKSIHIDFSSFSNLRDLQVVLTHDNSFLNNYLLVIKLVHYQSCDVFAVMCENMIQFVVGLRSEKQVVRTIINQLEKWQAFFEKLKGESLTPSEQQGL